MAKQVSSAELLKYSKTLKERIVRAVVASDTEMLAEAKKLLIEQTSGDVSTTMLRRMGHPFAVRNPQPSPPADIINSQREGGGLNEHWQEQPVVVTGSQTSGKVINTDPIAGFMLGTDLMVKRDVVGAVKKKIRRQRKECLKKHLEAEFNK
jgi:hypothetical protein